MIRFILLTLPFLLIAQEPILPIPTDIYVDIKKAKLGQELFFDTILSSDDSVSCFSCHNVYQGGADSREVSIGVQGKKGNIQSPTVLNARYNFKQFWNARASDLLEQVAGPLNNPTEHNMDATKIEKKLNNSSYKLKFQKIYNTKKVNYKDVLTSIVEFEKALITPNSKFDNYLRGHYVLSENEKQGYMIFKQYGCITCHNGINIGGNSYQKMGTFLEYPNKRKYPDKSELTKNKDDLNVFKVPTLRNISKTAPYFHDARAKNLKEAIELMAKYNLGIVLQDQEIQALIYFLYTLDGDTPQILEFNEPQ